MFRKCLRGVLEDMLGVFWEFFGGYFEDALQNFSCALQGISGHSWSLRAQPESDFTHEGMRTFGHTSRSALVGALVFAIASAHRAIVHQQIVFVAAQLHRRHFAHHSEPYSRAVSGVFQGCSFFCAHLDGI